MLENYEVSPENLAAEVEKANREKELRCSSADPTKYSSPDEHVLESNDRPMSSYMPEKFGLKGTVIPRATRLGGSRGYNPHAPKGIINIVNVGENGEGASSFAVDLGSLDHSKLNNLCEQVDFNKAPDITDIRADASSIFAELASKQASVAVKETIEREPPRIAPDKLPRGTYVVPKAGRNGSPLPVVNQKMAEPIAATVSLPPMNASVKKTVEEIPSPKFDVVFEIDGVGQVSGAYHHAVRDGDFLVLAYDTRYQGGTRFRPHRMENTMLVDVAQMPEVYEVHSAGIQFTIAGLEISVLVIKESQMKEIYQC